MILTQELLAEHEEGDLTFVSWRVLRTTMIRDEAEDEVLQAAAPVD